MTIEQYQTLSGLTVPANKTAFILANISRVSTAIEGILGFTLDTSRVNANQYNEDGKTAIECPTSVNLDNLQDPDPIIYSYRVYNYNKSDKFYSIDPCTEIHAVKLVNGNVTYKTLDADEYRVNYENGVIKSLERCCNWCGCECACAQLAVDATWQWADEDDIPSELLYVIADMVTYLSDSRRDIKSQTLGSHSYTTRDGFDPILEKSWNTTLSKYAGPYGSLRKTITI